MNFHEIYSYYSREDMQQALLKISKQREVVGVFRDGSFGQRPNTLVYPKDILAMIKNRVVAFHGSLEHWSQPMALGSENYETLRTGYDIIFDVDCKLLEHGKIAAKAFVWGLAKHGIKNVSLKFSGGKGFHLGLSWESIPNIVDYKPTAQQFPDIARKIIAYLNDFVRERLERELLKRWQPEELAKQVNKPTGKIFSEEGINPFEIVNIDPVLISPRHLFRLSYSLHEITFLVSLPLKPANLEEFKPEDARPEKVKIEQGFLDKGEEGEAELLVSEALDWWAEREAKKEKIFRRVRLTRAMPLKFAPPCIHTILKGLPDGRKRSVFILINFLSSLKWSWEEIETLLLKWNQKNKPPLRENYLRTHLRWHKNRRKLILPPNCSGEGWYKAIGVCNPDPICKRVKNPVNYPFRKLKPKLS